MRKIKLVMQEESIASGGIIDYVTTLCGIIGGVITVLGWVSYLDYEMQWNYDSWISSIISLIPLSLSYDTDSSKVVYNNLRKQLWAREIRIFVQPERNFETFFEIPFLRFLHILLISDVFVRHLVTFTSSDIFRIPVEIHMLKCFHEAITYTSKSKYIFIT